MKSTHLVYGIIYFIIAAFVGCSSSLAPTEVDPRARGAQADKDWHLVQTFNDELVLPRLKSLESELKEMRRQWAHSCDEGQLAMGDLRHSWERAIHDWHYLTTLTFAPNTVMEESSPLRFIYSPSTANAPTFIQREMARAGQLKESYKMSRPLGHSLGFQALEYLLFSWVPLSQNQHPVSADRGECYYGHYVLLDLTERIKGFTLGYQNSELAFARSVEGQTRLPEIIGRLAAHVVMFTDQVLKDRRLAAPMGQSTDLYPCSGIEECANSYIEHPYYPDKKIALRAPLQALNDLFNGRLKLNEKARTYAFRDYFASIPGSQTIAMADLIAQMESTVLNWPAGNAYINQFKLTASSPVNNLYRQSQKVSRWMKTDFLMDLNSSLPQAVQGDTD